MIRARKTLAVGLVALGSLAFAGTASATAPPRDVFVPTGPGNHVAYFPAGATSSSPLSLGGGKQIAITPDGTKAYVTTNVGTVGIIDVAATPTIDANSPITGVTGATDIAISPDGTTAYVGNGSGANNNISVINLSTRAVTTIDNGDVPDLVALSPDGTKLFVVTRISSTGPADGILRIRNASTGALIGNPVDIGFLAFSNAIAVAPDGNELYIANNAPNNTVSAVDLTATPNPTVNNISGFSSPTALAIKPNGSEVYVANQGSNNVSVIDTSTDTLEAGSIGVGLQPDGIFITPDGSTAYVANANQAAPGSSTVTPISTATKTAGSTVPVGTFPGDNPQSVSIVPDQGPMASFTDTPAQAGTSTGFDASASSDPEGTVASYHWDFGDGHSTDTSNATTSHTYAAGGNYNVTLTVTDDEGCAATFIYTGETASCNPNANDPKTSQVTIPAAPSGGGGGGGDTGGGTTSTPSTTPAAPTPPAKKCKKSKKHHASAAKKKCKK